MRVVLVSMHKRHDEGLVLRSICMLTQCMQLQWRIMQSVQLHLQEKAVALCHRHAETTCVLLSYDSLLLFMQVTAPAQKLQRWQQRIKDSPLDLYIAKHRVVHTRNWLIRVSTALEKTCLCPWQRSCSL